MRRKQSRTPSSATRRGHSRQRASIALLCALATASLVSCYHYRVAAPQVSNQNEPISVTKWSFFWGLLQEADEDTSCACLNNGLKETTASTNLAYVLLGVVTLGTVMPLELEYSCAKPPPDGKWPNPPPAAQCGFPVLPVPSGGAPAPRESSDEPCAPTAPSSTPSGAPTSPPVVPNDPDAGDF